MYFSQTERIEIMDFLHGLQYSQVRRIGLSSSFFIDSQRVILHEAISMVSEQKAR